VPADLVHRIHAAVADAAQAEGLLRESLGGGAAELRDVRLMASGIPRPQWNSADVSGPDPDLRGASGFYAARGLPWGVRVPAGMHLARMRHVTRLRLMSLDAGAVRPARCPPGLELAPAGQSELERVVDLDASVFEEDPEADRWWIEPHLSAPAIETAIAAFDGRPVATAYALRTDGRAGPALYLGGVAVLKQARRRGVAAAMTSWLLQRGFTDGAAFAHLHADSEESARVFTRLGFRDAGDLDVYAAP
jgi:RimJ/RimL family protein N-acetyltransferase